MGKRHTGFVHSMRFVFRHIRRNGFKTLLIILLATIFVVGITSIRLAIVNNEAGLEELYNTVTVDAELAKEDTTAFIMGDGFVYHTAVREIMETGYMIDSYLVGATRLTTRYGEGSDPQSIVYDRGGNVSSVTGVADLKKYLEGKSAVSVTYLDGYDETIFTTDWTEHTEGLPAVIPKMIYDSFSGEEDVYLRVTYNDREYEKEYAWEYKVVGYYEGDISYNADVLVPLSALVQGFHMQGIEGRLTYSTAKFTIDPAMNRSVQKVKESIQEIVNGSYAGVVKLQALFWDSELRMVIEPMEDSIRLLKILYPVVLAVSVLIAAGVCVLLTMMSTKDAAIMHVQGTSKARVRFILTMQMMFTSIIGLMIGLIGMYIYMSNVKQPEMNAIFMQSLQASALYMIAALIGAVITSVFVTKKHPIELLQVKE